MFLCSCVFPCCRSKEAKKQIKDLGPSFRGIPTIFFDYSLGKKKVIHKASLALKGLLKWKADMRRTFKKPQSVSNTGNMAESQRRRRAISCMLKDTQECLWLTSSGISLPFSFITHQRLTWRASLFWYLATGKMQQCCSNGLDPSQPAEWSFRPLSRFHSLTLLRNLFAFHSLQANKWT